jgi:catechol 2,3-dioxygenase-like lactoylglutathione lyase family enzyme
MEMTLRVEIFPADLDATVGFYTNILGFIVTKDERAEPSAYVSPDDEAAVPQPSSPSRGRRVDSARIIRVHSPCGADPYRRLISTVVSIVMR